MTVTIYKAHPLSGIIPLSTESQYATLRDSIRDSHRVLVPIVLYEGQILDGRTRHKVCLELGIEFPTEEFVGDYAAAATRVRDLNVARRQMTKGQCQIASGRLSKIINGSNRFKTKAKVGSGDTEPTFTQAAAAKIFGVERNAPCLARVVLEKGIPELVEAVEKEEIGLNTASQLAILPKGRQLAAIAEKKVPKLKLGRKPQEQRIKDVRQLAGIGYSPAQIANELGVVVGYVRGIASKAGIPLYNTGRINVNRIVDQTCVSLANLESTIGLVSNHTEELNQAELDGWTDSLVTARESMTKLIKLLKGAKHYESGKDSQEIRQGAQV